MASSDGANVSRTARAPMAFMTVTTAEGVFTRTSVRGQGGHGKGPLGAGLGVLIGAQVACGWLRGGLV
jgi:hypothetical protein